jgi:hypothetical protein
MWVYWTLISDHFQPDQILMEIMQNSHLLKLKQSKQTENIWSLKCDVNICWAQNLTDFISEFFLGQATVLIVDKKKQRKFYFSGKYKNEWLTIYIDWPYELRFGSSSFCSPEVNFQTSEWIQQFLNEFIFCFGYEVFADSKSYHHVNSEIYEHFRQENSDFFQRFLSYITSFGITPKICLSIGKDEVFYFAKECWETDRIDMIEIQLDKYGKIENTFFYEKFRKRKITARVISLFDTPMYQMFEGDDNTHIESSNQESLLRPGATEMDVSDNTHVNSQLFPECHDDFEMTVCDNTPVESQMSKLTPIYQAH